MLNVENLLLKSGTNSWEWRNGVWNDYVGPIMEGTCWHGCRISPDDTAPVYLAWSDPMAKEGDDLDALKLARMLYYILSYNDRKGLDNYKRTEDIIGNHDVYTSRRDPTQLALWYLVSQYTTSKNEKAISLAQEFLCASSCASR